MVDADQDQKTEEPTGKRLSEARDEGQLAVSREVATWVMFVALFVVLKWLGPPLGQKVVTGLRLFLERPEQLSLQDGGMQDALMGVLSHVAFAAILVYGVLYGAAILGTMLQTGFYINPGRIKFDPSKVLSMSGLKRLFSSDSLVELGKSFVKLVVLGYMAYRVIQPIYEEAPQFITHSFLDVMSYLHDRALHLIIILMVMITVMAVADLLYVRYQYFKGLRMTKQEVKEEFKQMEGDPFVKNRLRRIRLEKARRRMIAKVPKASVVITNPTHYAVALQYDQATMHAPVVVAKGVDQVALRIRTVAEENDVPIVRNPPLSRALYDTVDLDQPISPDHYKGVANVISYVYKLKNKKVQKAQ